MTTSDTRGIRNNNPGNIRWRDNWMGLVPEQQRTDTAFCQFVSPECGIRAMMIILNHYQIQHGLNTIAEIIHRWAPPEENDTQAYISSVVTVSGIPAHKHLDLSDSTTMLKLVQAIIVHENGYQPYDASVLQRAEKLAHP
ncbi:structural protein [Pantoea stewartii]|uniref:structural protein n=1 Tax=Pantoea stewartii TaxID=66269 RepID=UPI00197E511C|nr:structural protein [Pantoea stewartii]